MAARRRRPAALLLVTVAALAAPACGSPDGGSGDAPLADAPPAADAKPCPAPQVCGPDCCAPGDLCTAQGCCAIDHACGEVCCGGQNSCQAGECRLDCGAGAPPPCGPTGAEACCAAGDVCYLDACTTPGPACDDIYDCGIGAYCEPTLGRCLPLPEGEVTCAFPPAPAGVFTPGAEWTWTGSPDVPTHDQVMMQPVVADVSGDGIPDVLFHTFTGSAYGSDGVLRAVSGDTGAELWSVTAPAWRTVPGSMIAIADLDGDGPPEILACGSPSGGLYPLLAFEHDGTPRWATTDPQVVCGYSAPSVANLDEAGPPEILVRYTVVNADGSVRFRAAVADGLSNPASLTSFADVTGDGLLDIVGGNGVFDGTGAPVWSRVADFPDGWHAVADLDVDGDGDVVLVQSGTHTIMAFHGDDGSNLWPAPQDVNQGVPTPSGPNGGGPPTVADFDGDDLPEVAAAGGYGYVVYEGEDGTPKWFQATQDLSSRVTGSSVFDFEDDGLAEVVYGDELELHVYRGTDGVELFSACNTTGTLWEYPVIVDVDADDRAEIVVARNNYAFHTCADGTPSATGIAVFGDALDNWVRTRRIWNQHTYHVTNVNESGSIPQDEVPNWSAPGLNNFRQNVQPFGVSTAPDLVVTSLGADLDTCPAHIRLEAAIRNAGAAGAPANVPVAFYEGAGPYTFLGHGLTTEPLLPGQTTIAVFLWPVPAERMGETFTFHAAVDDDGTGGGPGLGAGTTGECEEGNNVSLPAQGECPAVE